MQQENNKNGIDLSETFKELIPESKSEQRLSKSYGSPPAPKIIRWLIKYSGGLIKNEKQATYVLLVFIIFTVIISLFLIFSKGSGPNTSEPTGPEIEEIEKAGSPEEIIP